MKTPLSNILTRDALDVIILMALLAVCVSGAAVPAPQTLDRIMNMNPSEFTQLEPGDAMRALNQLSAAGETRKLSELFDSYASTRMDLAAKFQLTSKTAISPDGLKAPNGDFLDFKTLKDFITSHIKEAVSVFSRANGFEIRTAGAKGQTALSSQGFKTMSFTKDGMINLDGNIIRPEEGKSAYATADKDGTVHLDGKGYYAPKGGKGFEFQGRSSVVGTGKIIIEASSGGKNWIRMNGQRIIPKDAAMVAFTERSKFNAERTLNKALIWDKDERTITTVVRQANVGGVIGGEFQIGRSIKTIGPDGKSVINEELVTFSRSGTTNPSTSGRTYDSFFNQLKGATSSTRDKAKTWLKMGRNSDPSLIEGLQRLIGVDERGDDGTVMFGSKTRQAVMGFEERHGLSVTGIVGPKVYAALSAEYNKESSSNIYYYDAQGRGVTIDDTGFWYRKDDSPTAGVGVSLDATVDRASTGRLTTDRTRTDATAMNDDNRDEMISALRGGYWHMGVRQEEYTRFVRSYCYDGSVNLAEQMGYARPPSPDRIRNADLPDKARFAEGTFQREELSEAKVGDPIYFATPDDSSHPRAGSVSHIATVVGRTSDPNDPVIAHSFSGKPRVERLSAFRRAYSGGSQGWDRASVYAYRKV